MKKITFNDKYGLTKAVLEGRKTQTRRIVSLTLHKMSGMNLTEVYPDQIFLYEGAWLFRIENKIYGLPKENRPKYNIGEIVAIAQRYKDAGLKPNTLVPTVNGYKIPAIIHKGWNNKMFVSSNLMPHQIFITNVRVNRLQDISDDDCLKEGIIEPTKEFPWYSFGSKSFLFNEPKKAYSFLIDKIYGEGTWDKNPFVFVSDFYIIK